MDLHTPQQLPEAERFQWEKNFVENWHFCHCLKYNFINMCEEDDKTYMLLNLGTVHQQI